ncbi:MAG TPA: hypothetical protein VEC60_18595 [Reyranella sp.]|nr:hypothetical protein [Reyranella sp.]
MADPSFPATGSPPSSAGGAATPPATSQPPATRAVDVDLAALDARLKKSESLQEESQKALETESRRRELDDRSTIAKLIVNVFVYSSAGVLVLLVAAAAFAGGWNAWKDAAEFCLKVLSSVLLPVVTLVIGYYFGKEKQ